MTRGKQTCKILKEIRRRIAEANDIEYVTSECSYKGDCLGTCPKCEAEVRYLEQQLSKRVHIGKAAVIAGISAGTLTMLMPLTSNAQTVPETESSPVDKHDLTVSREKLNIKGRVLGKLNKDKDPQRLDALTGAIIKNLDNGQATVTDQSGRFEIQVTEGDSIEVSYIGYSKKKIAADKQMKHLEIVLDDGNTVLMGECEIKPAK